MLGVLVVLTVLAFGGCGDDSPAADPLTKAQLAAREDFIAKATAFCDRSRVEWERKGAAVFKLKARYYERKGSLEEFRHVVRQQQVGTVMAPLMLRRIEEVRDLGIPPRDQRRVERILDQLKAAVTSVKEGPHTYFQGNEDLDRARDLAAAYGIESCAVLATPTGVFQRASVSPGTLATPRSSK